MICLAGLAAPFPPVTADSAAEALYAGRIDISNRNCSLTKTDDQQNLAYTLLMADPAVEMAPLAALVAREMALPALEVTELAPLLAVDAALEVADEVIELAEEDDAAALDAADPSTPPE